VAGTWLSVQATCRVSGPRASLSPLPHVPNLGWLLVDTQKKGVHQVQNVPCVVGHDGFFCEIAVSGLVPREPDFVCSGPHVLGDLARLG
jgi:hypothetical protein